MNNEVKGRVVALLPAKTGQGKKGQWTKQEVVIETEGRFPRKVAVQIWNDAFKVKVGEEVTVRVDIESREHNGNWYTDIKAFALVTGATATATSVVNGHNDDLPF